MAVNIAYNITKRATLQVEQTESRMPMNKPITIGIQLLIILICLTAIVNLGRSVYDLASKRSNATKLAVKRDAVKRESEMIEKKLNDAQTKEFIEREARDRLGLSKPGEVIVLLEKGDIEASNTANLPVSTWSQWLSLFF